MIYDKVLIFTDNGFILKEFNKIINHYASQLNVIDYACSLNNLDVLNIDNISVKELRIKDNINFLLEKYNLIISCHSKQIFPKELVENIKCINIHPGYNPDTRGWYPQVFSILHNIKVGVTIHEMNERVDSGDIIMRNEIKINEGDTSFSAYQRIQKEEVRMLDETLYLILMNNYSTFTPEGDGNYFSKKHFNDLCEIDMNEKGTFKDFYNKLRALSHPPFDNAYFLTEDGEKIYLEIKISR